MGRFESNIYTNPQSMGQSSAEWHDDVGKDRGSSFFGMLSEAMTGSGGYGPTQRNKARADASEYEDSYLRQLLGSSRKKGKDEKIPDGTLALYDYPGLRHAVDWASTGNAPGGANQGSATGWLREQNDQAYGDRMRTGRKDWAQNQKDVLGWRY